MHANVEGVFLRAYFAVRRIYLLRPNINVAYKIIRKVLLNVLGRKG